MRFLGLASSSTQEPHIVMTASTILTNNHYYLNEHLAAMVQVTLLVNVGCCSHENQLNWKSQTLRHRLRWQELLLFRLSPELIRFRTRVPKPV